MSSVELPWTWTSSHLGGGGELDPGRRRAPNQPGPPPSLCHRYSHSHSQLIPIHLCGQRNYCSLRRTGAPTSQSKRPGEGDLPSVGEEEGRVLIRDCAGRRDKGVLGALDILEVVEVGLAHARCGPVAPLRRRRAAHSDSGERDAKEGVEWGQAREAKEHKLSAERPA